MRYLAFALFVPAALWTWSAAAEYRIMRDQGGPIEEYKAKYEAIRALGERVVIDGPCDSACTLVLGIVPLDRICVTPRASLGFHMAYYDLAATDGVRVVSYVQTAEFMSLYPSAVKDWLSRNGGITRYAKYITNGPELWSIVQPCPKDVR
jgi:hypothetical protein